LFNNHEVMVQLDISFIFAEPTFIKIELLTIKNALIPPPIQFLLYKWVNAYLFGQIASLHSSILIINRDTHEIDY